MKRKNRITAIDQFALLVHPYVDSTSDAGDTTASVVYKSYELAGLMLEQRQRYFKQARQDRKDMAEMKATMSPEVLARIEAQK